MSTDEITFEALQDMAQVNIDAFILSEGIQHILQKLFLENKIPPSTVLMRERDYMDLFNELGRNIRPGAWFAGEFMWSTPYGEMTVRVVRFHD